MMCILLFTLAPSWLLYENILFSLCWTDLSSISLQLESFLCLTSSSYRFLLAEKCCPLCLLLYPFTASTWTYSSITQCRFSGYWALSCYLLQTDLNTVSTLCVVWTKIVGIKSLNISSGNFSKSRIVLWAFRVCHRSLGCCGAVRGMFFSTNHNPNQCTDRIFPS